MIDPFHMQKWVEENGYVLHKGGGRNARIVVMGEYDHYGEAQEKQIECVYLLRPGAVLNESLNNMVFLPDERGLKENPLYKAGNEAISYYKAYQSSQKSDFIWVPSTAARRFLQEEGLNLSDDYLSRSELLCMARNYGLSTQLPDYIDDGFMVAAWWPFIRYCIDNNAYLAGCDLPTEESVYKTRLFGGQGGLSPVAPELIFEREQIAGNTVLEYYERTERPVLSVHGGYHIRPESEIFKTLDACNLDYIVIEQRN